MCCYEAYCIHRKKMDILTFLLVMISLLVGALSTLNCPLNETEWNYKSKMKVCQGKDVYHCLVMEDGKTREEKCIERTLIMNGNCPIFTNDYYLHWRTCNKTGCPSMPYRSDEVFKFPVCFEIESEENDIQWSQQSRRKDDTFALKIGLPLGLIPAVLVIAIVVILIIKKRQQTLKCLSGFRRNDDDDDANDVPELRKLVKKPEYISIAIDQLKTKKIIYVIGQLGNSVSTSGKKITKIYAKRHKMSNHYYNYLDISQKFSELCPEKVFKRKTVNFIDGWGGLWNENPCERKRTLDILVQVVEQSKSLENKKFVIGLRTEIYERLKDKLLTLEIRISEHERVLLDYSSIYKRKKIEEEITLLQNFCPDVECGCKSLTLERVSEVDQVPIGTFLVVKLMSLDHKMIPDFLRRDTGPLKAVQNLFDGLMEGDQMWPWLPYFVCLGYHDLKEFRQDIAREFDISEDMMSDPVNIGKYTKIMDKDKLAPMWSKRFNLVKGKEVGSRKVFVFWHNFLYICAFHACYKKYPKQMLQFCNLDAVLQLVRPKSHPDSLAITATDEEVDFFCEERLKNLADDDVFLEHPLVIDWKTRTKE